MTKKRKAKFRVGQVVAECFRFGTNREKEHVRAYFAITNKHMAQWIEPWHHEAMVTADGVRYYRPLTARERGERRKGKGK